jgi:hypothetical protein
VLERSVDIVRGPGALVPPWLVAAAAGHNLPAPPTPLVGRERELLVITSVTANNHVKHILAKLGLDSRVQIAAWAVEQGLHRSSSS